MRTDLRSIGEGVYAELNTRHKGSLFWLRQAGVLLCVLVVGVIYLHKMGGPLFARCLRQSVVGLRNQLPTKCGTADYAQIVGVIDPPHNVKSPVSMRGEEVRAFPVPWNNIRVLGVKRSIALKASNHPAMWCYPSSDWIVRFSSIVRPTHGERSLPPMDHAQTAYYCRWTATDIRNRELPNNWFIPKQIINDFRIGLLHNGVENHAPNDYLWSKLQEQSFIGDFPLPNGRNPQPTSEYGQQNSGDDGSNLPSDGKPTLWGWIVIVIGVGISGAGGWFGTWLILVRKYWTGGLLMLGSAGLTFLCWLWAS